VVAAELPIPHENPADWLSCKITQSDIDRCTDEIVRLLRRLHGKSRKTFPVLAIFPAVLFIHTETSNAISITVKISIRHRR